MRRLRFGLVGCGNHATQYQLPALVKSPDVDLVALVDVDEDWCRRVARRFGVPECSTDPAALIGKVDAVLVATPNATHAELTSLLLGHGVHVLCEKPMCTSSPEFDLIAASAARSSARVMAAHCLRFSSNLRLLRQLLSDGRLGEVREIRAELGTPYRGASHRTDFRTKRLAGGGVLVDLGVHVIDLALWLVQRDATAVDYVADFRQGWDVEDNIQLELDFGAGTRAVLACSFTEQLSNAITVRCTDGWAKASLHDPTSLQIFGSRINVCQRDGAQTVLPIGEDIYVAQLEHFCRAIAEGRPFGITLDQIKSGIRIMEECSQTATAAA